VPDSLAHERAAMALNGCLHLDNGVDQCSAACPLLHDLWEVFESSSTSDDRDGESAMDAGVWQRLRAQWTLRDP
jgi:hypothetical protein